MSKKKVFSKTFLSYSKLTKFFPLSINPIHAPVSTLNILHFKQRLNQKLKNFFLLHLLESEIFLAVRDENSVGVPIPRVQL